MPYDGGERLPEDPPASTPHFQYFESAADKEAFDRRIDALIASANEPEPANPEEPWLFDAPWPAELGAFPKRNARGALMTGVLPNGLVDCTLARMQGQWMDCHLLRGNALRALRAQTRREAHQQACHGLTRQQKNTLTHAINRRLKKRNPRQKLKYCLDQDGAPEWAIVSIDDPITDLNALLARLVAEDENQQ